MRTSTITATITTLIFCIGDVSAYSDDRGTGPRFDRRGIPYDAPFERSLDNHGVYERAFDDHGIYARSFDDFDLEIVEREAFDRGISVGRDLQEREMSRGSYNGLAIRDYYGSDLTRRVDLTWQDKLAISTAICGFITFGIAAFGTYMVLIGRVGESAAAPIARLTGKSKTEVEQGAVAMIQKGSSMPGALPPPGQYPTTGSTAANAPKTIKVPPGKWELVFQSPGGVPQEYLSFQIKEGEQCVLEAS